MPLNQYKETRQSLWVGIGCKRGSSTELLVWAVVQALASYGLEKEAIAGFATIDRKTQEPGLISLATNWNLPLLGMSVDILSKIPVPHPSRLVAEAVGTPSVAEAAALAAAMMHLESFPSLFSDLFPKLFPKQIYRLPNQLGVVAVAIVEISPPPEHDNKTYTNSVINCYR